MKKVLTTVLAAVLLAAMATGVAVASEPSTQDRMADAAAALALLDGNDDADKKLEKAAAQLAKGLDASNFDADGEPIDKKAMDALRKVAKELTKAAEKDPSLDVSLIDELVDIARDAAEAGLAAAEARGVAAEDIAKAAEELAKADSEEKPDKAIDRYKKAWKRALNSNAAGTSASAGGGKYSVYTFQFLDTRDNSIVTVTESNAWGEPGYTGKSNEGFMEVLGETIQLHVSCSDAFTGGTGDKSDPTEDSFLRVLDYTIVKYDEDGTISKTCNLVGMEMPAIDVEKGISSDNGLTFADADTPAEAISVMEFDPITFRIVVTNTGNVPLTGVTVTDPLFDLGPCGFPTELAPGDSASCDIDVQATLGDRSNTASVSGQGLGMTVSDSDSTHYAATGLG